MFPKVGDVVKLNPNFLKIWFKRNSYFGGEVWKEKFIVTEIGSFIKDEFIIEIRYEDFSYKVYILSNGESNLSDYNNEYEGIQVFITDNPEIKNNIYCSCGGPVKENWILWERFYVCTICKKEKLI